MDMLVLDRSVMIRGDRRYSCQRKSACLRVKIYYASAMQALPMEINYMRNTD